MQVACAFVICLGQSIPFSIPLSIRVRHPTERDIVPSVWSCRILLDVAEGVASLLRCDDSDVFLLYTHVLCVLCPKVLEHLFVCPVGTLVDLRPRSRHRVGVQLTFLVGKK